METTPKIQMNTIIRTVVLVVALINQILVSTGHSPLPIEDEQLNELVSLLITIIASLIAWWKNNSFTKIARKADQYKAELKEVEKNG